MFSKPRISPSAPTTSTIGTPPNAHGNTSPGCDSWPVWVTKCQDRRRMLRCSSRKMPRSRYQADGSVQPSSIERASSVTATAPPQSQDRWTSDSVGIVSPEGDDRARSLGERVEDADALLGPVEVADLDRPVVEHSPAEVIELAEVAEQE